MATFKVTYFFNAGKAGWTETYYVDGVADLSAALRVAAQPAPLRAEMLSPGWSIEAIRASDVATPRVFITDPTVYVPTVDFNDPPPRDLIQVDALIRASSTDFLYRRNVFLRGVNGRATRWPMADVKPSFSAGFTSLFNRWRNLVLQAPPFSIRAISKDPRDVNLQKISGLAAVPGFPEQTQISAVGFNAIQGETIRVSGVHGLGWTGLNGLKKVTLGGANQFNVQFPSADPAQWDGKGVVKHRLVIYPVIARLQLWSVSTHNTGRAFFVRRGRRRVSKT